MSGMPFKPRILSLLRALSILAALGSIAGPGLAARPTTFMPQWTPGQSWKVKVQYRALTAADLPRKYREVRWSDPVDWDFEVLGIEQDRNLRVHHIMARSRMHEDGPLRTAGFFVLGEVSPGGDLETLSMAKATYESLGREGMETETVDYTRMATGPFPVLHDSALVPADFPCFEETSLSESKPFERRYEVTQESGEMYYAYDVIQRVKEIPTPKKNDPRILFPEPGGPIQEYRLLRPADGSAAYELWSASLPWSLYMENARMRAWLVEVNP